VGVQQIGVVGGRTQSFARVRAGRIVEINLRRLAVSADVEALRAQVSALIRQAGPGAVICADHRFASPLSAEIADGFSRAIRAGNGQIVRGGLLLEPTNAMYNLQVERVVHCAGNPALRLFTDIDELRDWVGEVLTETEREALRELFSGTETG
jgi:hypothetical protein